MDNSQTAIATPRQVRPTASTGAYYAAFVTLGLMAAILGPTLPGLAANTGVGIDQIGLLFTARSAGYLVGAFAGGRLYDRFPGHTLMAIFLFGVAITVGATPMIGQFWTLIVLIAIMGIAEAGVDIGGNAMLTWIHRGNTGPYMNALHFFFGLGAFFSPIIVAQAILLTGGINGAYWMLALLTIPVAIAVLPLASPHAPTSIHSGVTEIRTNRPLVMLSALFMLIYVGCEVGFGGWIYTYAISLQLAEAVTAAYVTSLFWGAYTIGRLAAIPIATRVRPRTMLLGDLTGAIISISAMIIWRQSSVMLWVGAFAFGLSIASIFPTLLAWAERRMTMTGAVTSWFFIGSSVGAMIFPWLIGRLFAPIGPQVMTIGILILLLIDCVIFAALMAVGGEPHHAA